MGRTRCLLLVLKPLLSLLLFPLIVVACIGGLAFAHGGPRLEKLGEAPIEQEPFSIQAIAPRADDRPQGWSAATAKNTFPEAAPTETAVLALAKNAGVDAKGVTIRVFHWIHDGSHKGVLLLCGMPKPTASLISALAGALTERRWTVCQLGGPSRLAIAWSDQSDGAADLLRWMQDHAAAYLCASAVEEIELSGEKGDRSLYLRAFARLNSAGRIQPRAARYHAIKGRMLVQLKRGLEALPHLRVILEEGLPVPATDEEMWYAANVVGTHLLVNGGPQRLQEALRALTRAVKLEMHAMDALSRFGDRYNLACALVRLKKFDDAFRELEASLAKGKRELGRLYSFHFEHCRDKDTDMAPLKSDPRFDEILKKFAPEPRRAPEADDGKPAPEPSGEAPNESGR